MLVSKEKLKLDFDDPDEVRGPIFSVRFLISLLLIAAGIVYVVLWTLYVRDLRTFENTFPQPKGGAPDTLIPGMDKLDRSEEHTSELQSLMRTSYAVFCLKKKTTDNNTRHQTQ